jgi:hypothetical protein
MGIFFDGGCIEGSRFRLTVRINASQKRDPPLGACEQTATVAEQANAVLVSGERVVEAELPAFQSVHGALELMQGLFKSHIGFHRGAPGYVKGPLR